MAPHSSTLAWKIPWTEEPGRLQSMGLLRVGHDWATSLSLFTFMHWRRKWQPTLVFLPGESQGRGSLVGCRLWGHRVGHDWSDLAAAAAADLKAADLLRPRGPAPAEKIVWCPNQTWKILLIFRALGLWPRPILSGLGVYSHWKTMHWCWVCEAQASLARRSWWGGELSQPAGSLPSPWKVTYLPPAETRLWPGHSGAHCARRPSSGWSLLTGPGQRCLQRATQQPGSPR